MDIEGLASMVEREMQHHGWSRYELGMRAGKRSMQAVYRLLDRKPITLGNALRIMDVLGIQLVEPTPTQRREVAAAARDAA